MTYLLYLLWFLPIDFGCGLKWFHAPLTEDAGMENGAVECGCSMLSLS